MLVQTGHLEEYVQYGGERYATSHGVWGAEGRFTYFYYYLDLFPVVWRGGEDRGAFGPRSVEEARRHLETDGQELYTEYEYVIRTCRWGIYALLLADAHVRKLVTGVEDLYGLDGKYANTLASTVAMVALLSAFWVCGQRVLGIIVVLLVWSHPFMLPNHGSGPPYLMGWVIMTSCYLLALNLPIICMGGDRRLPRGVLAILAGCSGLVLGVGDQIRGEIAVMLLGPIMVYLTAAGLRWRARWALVLVFGLCWLGFEKWADSYWDAKHAEATAVVAEAGGHVWSGELPRRHPVWPTIWSGLGDFGGKYGFVWDDGINTAYAWRLLRDKYGWTDQDISGFHDAEGKFPKFFWHHGPVEAIFRNSVLGKIRRDPAWFVGVMAKRLVAVFDTTVPVFLALPPKRAVLPISGWFVVPLVLWLLHRGRREHAIVILFTLPVSFIMLVISTEFDMPYFSIYHLIGCAVVCSEVLRWGAAWARLRLGWSGTRVGEAP
jgi:hypothetical protein